ncbi:MAG: prepilin peptidase [Candidatus Aenigmarchaeota archaeon]|nr:prepilin peptidase [Candidatus Aenigmarchaeota archaeon]
MFDILLMLVGSLGFAYTGYKDLKTTEFPDWVPYAIMVSSVLIKLAEALVINDFTIFTGSIINGLLLFGIGYILYFLGTWADGDAYILGALGFLFPLKTSLFNPTYFLPLPLMLISNVFLFGGIYMIVYAFAIGFRNKWIFTDLKKDLSKNARKLFLSIFLISTFAFGATYMMAKSFNVAINAALLSVPAGFIVYSILLIFLWRYVKLIDKKIFVKKIPASKLRFGDIPVSAKLLRMPDPEMIKKLRAKGGYIKIKEGVRFTPVFLIAFIFTLVYGDAIYWVLKIIGS